MSKAGIDSALNECPQEVVRDRGAISCFVLTQFLLHLVE